MFDQIFFDFDSTLVTVEGIDEIAAVLAQPEVANLTSSAMNGSISVEDAYRRRLELLKLTPAHLRMLGKVYQASLVPGAVDLVRVLKSLGKKVGIVSGGFQEAILPCAQLLEMDYVEAVGLDFSGDWAVLVPSDLLTRGGKAKVLSRLKNGVCAFVGDGITDLETETVADRFIPYSGVIRRSFIEKCVHPGYSGGNLLGLLPMLLNEEELKVCARVYPAEVNKACEILLEGQFTTGSELFNRTLLEQLLVPSNYIPGPTQPNPDFKTNLLPMPGHRSQEFEDLFQRVLAKLHAFLGWDGKFLICASSGTGMLEAVLSSLDKHHVLSLQSGDFSKRWASIATTLGYEVDVLTAPPRQGVSSAQLRDSNMLAGKDIMLITHSETSNATMNPVEELACTAKEVGAPLVLVDGISSIGGIDLDVSHVDGVVFASQKCLAVAPGLSFLWVSERLEEALKVAKSKSFYFDLKRYLEYLDKGNVPYTPAIGLMQSLDLQLEEFLRDREAHFKTYRDMASRVWQFCNSEGLEIHGQEGYRSLTVSCIENPKGINLVQKLRQKGLNLATGYGDLQKSHFRIGHMGRVKLPDLEGLLSAIKEYTHV